jgi:hypothetical protein
VVDQDCLAKPDVARSDLHQLVIGEKSMASSRAHPVIEVRTRDRDEAVAAVEEALVRLGRS